MSVSLTNRHARNRSAASAHTQTNAHACSVSMNSARLGLYRPIKQHLVAQYALQPPSQQKRVMIDLAASIPASICGAICGNPFMVAKTREAAVGAQNVGFVEAMARIVRSEGVAGLFKGLSGACVWPCW